VAGGGRRRRRRRRRCTRPRRSRPPRIALAPVFVTVCSGWRPSLHAVAQSHTRHGRLACCSLRIMRGTARHGAGALGRAGARLRIRQRVPRWTAAAVLAARHIQPPCLLHAPKPTAALHRPLYRSTASRLPLRGHRSGILVLSYTRKLHVTSTSRSWYGMVEVLRSVTTGHGWSRRGGLRHGRQGAESPGPGLYRSPRWSRSLTKPSLAQPKGRYKGDRSVWHESPRLLEPLSV
jgi:hypothetical protein